MTEKIIMKMIITNEMRYSAELKTLGQSRLSASWVVKKKIMELNFSKLSRFIMV